MFNLLKSISLLTATLFFTMSYKTIENINLNQLSVNYQLNDKADCCIAFNELNNKIRDGLIPKEDALKQLKLLIPQINAYYYAHGGIDYNKKSRVFPVEGYNQKAIGGKNGSGYSSAGFDYLNGNSHKGHPAHDIFIYDTNRDCNDDKTKAPVNVLSFTAGIVVALNTGWDSTSVLRGGNYIWVYEPSTKSLFYYAHNNSVNVKLGAIVKPGEVIATVGRTGLNAFVKRSPTHLHFMQLVFDDSYYPKPYNCYKDVLTARLK